MTPFFVHQFFVKLALNLTQICLPHEPTTITSFVVHFGFKL
jgi:hypothetical protein